MNKAQLIGHLGKDPDIRTGQSGSKVASFSVATSQAWKDKKTGERKEKTEWHRLVVFNPGLVSVAERYLRKGTKVFVEGQLATRKWTDGKGHDNYTTEIVVREILLLDRKPDAAAQPGSPVDDMPIDDSYADIFDDAAGF